MKILIMGPQGSGKSTQAQVLAKDLDVPFISAGALVREIAATNTDLGRRLKEKSEKGELVLDSDLDEVMNQRLSQGDCKKGFVLDGYPRHRKQLDDLNRYLEKTSKKIDKVFYIDLPDEEGISRLLKRDRSDDRINLIKRRLEIFHQDTMPIIEYFKKQKLVEIIDGRPSIEEIHKQIVEKLNLNHEHCQIAN